ncbi:MAG: hypothetical protein V3U11_14185, partial [Planctomycetota bacterium]
QYVEGSKPIGAAERKVAINEQHPYRTGVIKGYPALVARTEDLSLAGVRFFDLRMLFKDITQQLYIDDCCHLNREGNAILARAIASAVCEAVDLESATLAGIRVQHTTMVLDDPMVRQPIRVIGTFDDSKQRLVSVAHAGTRYSSSDPSVVTVSADGMLQARRQGHARIRIHNGPFETQVEVVSRWRPVLSFGVGSPGNGGETPVLAAEGEPRVGNQDFKLRISNVVGGAKGFLLVADHLAPPRENPFGAVLVSPSWPKVDIQANGPDGRPGAGTLVHPLPIPNNPAFRGRTTYLQAVFTDENAADKRSATNGLRVTVQ